MESRSAREALLSDLAASVAGAAATLRDRVEGTFAHAEFDPDDLRDALTTLRGHLSDAEGRAALEVVVFDAMSNLIHSVLVTLDGGSPSCPTLELRDPEGRSLGVALHEEWPDFDPAERGR